MSPTGNLFKRLQHLDESGSTERLAARKKRQDKSNAEILQTFLAYKLDHASKKMQLGIGIGDPLTLLHEPSNEWDPNAVKVFWNDQCIGYIPKDMAALIAAEVPEVATGLDAVVTGLTTTSLRDAFRLQISIPIANASRRLRGLGVTSSFAWDFDRTSGADKLRLVINCTETAFRELQQLLAASYDVSKRGYSYYPTQDGRHYPWYLSITDSNNKAPDSEKIEQLIRSLFGVPSEATRILERQEKLKELQAIEEDINKRLDSSRAEERRLRREYEFNKAAWERRTEKAQAQGEEAIELAEDLENELKQEMDLKDQELQLALAENRSLGDQLEQITAEHDAMKLQLAYLEQVAPVSGQNDFGYTPWRNSNEVNNPEDLNSRLLSSLRSIAGRERLKPRSCLELVSEQLCPGTLLILDSAWSSADQARGFEYGDQLFELLWLLATSFRTEKIAGTPDIIAGRVFGSVNYAPRESQTIERNPKSRRERTFNYANKTVEMWQHLKIGAKDSENQTLRIHFCWDEQLAQIVIGHCGKHLFNPNH